MNNPEPMNEYDPAQLDASEELDEDRLGVDPLEEGVEPAEHWSGANQFGTTPAEQREGESLERRLAQEQPDAVMPEEPGRPVAVTPVDQLNESVDDAPADVEPITGDEQVRGRHSLSGEQRENADVAGGSVAESFRTPVQE